MDIDLGKRYLSLVGSDSDTIKSSQAAFASATGASTGLNPRSEDLVD
jgi:hypothetical protein